MYMYHDFLQKAYHVLQKHPKVNCNRIAILGASLGGGIALKMAVYSQMVEVSSHQF